MAARRNKQEADSTAAVQEQYVVVARRYRPQTFEELIGQSHVARALMNAIRNGRVGHAYLFTGARGVGKTSTARILAKALNCEKGPTPTPCNQCDICRSINTGEDVDVLEIDGASNRGIDEIRQLRQNVTIRPSRARHKIYIIDEVHMLTREAFNALLKTLEEPPGHVKFVFCTTEPGKVPITILSRCQRFDFAGIEVTAIVDRLSQIAESEGVQAEKEALEMLARRAAGSMRDAQSLLEQLLAFAEDTLSVSDVHRALGTAGTDRLERIVACVTEGQAKEAIEELRQAIHEGVDASLLLEQLLTFYRDMMVALLGCPGEYLLAGSPSGRDKIADLGQRVGLQGTMFAMQLIDQTLARLRVVTHDRILAELTLVRLAHLEHLDALPQLIRQAQTLGATGRPARVGRDAPARSPSPGTAAKKKPHAAEMTPSAHIATDAGTDRAELPAQPGDASESEPSAPGAARSGRLELTEATAMEVWRAALEQITGMAADQARRFDRLSVPAPGRLLVSFRPQYEFSKKYCENTEQVAKFEKALTTVTGSPVRVEFALSKSGGAAPMQEPEATSPQKLLFEKAQNPLVKHAVEVFGARPTAVLKARRPAPPPESDPASSPDIAEEDKEDGIHQ